MIHTPEVGKCNEVHRKRTKKKIYPQKKSKLNLHDGKKKTAVNKRVENKCGSLTCLRRQTSSRMHPELNPSHFKPLAVLFPIYLRR